MLRFVIALVLAAHGVGHTIGVAGGWANGAWGGTGSSWLLSPVLGRSVGFVEGALWLLPSLGFLAAAGALMAGSETWRLIALVSAVASLAVITIFPQQLSIGSLIGALAVDAAVLIGLYILNWPAADAIGA